MVGAPRVPRRARSDLINCTSVRNKFRSAMPKRKRKFNQKSNEHIQQNTRKKVNNQNTNRKRANGEPPLKKPKIGNESTACVSVHQRKLDLSEFRYKRMLNFNPSKKEITLEGKFEGSESAAIVILEKKISRQWPLLEQEFFNNKTFTKPVSINDVYGNYTCFGDDCNGWKLRIIHPASQKHLDKYKRKGSGKMYLINETYETYEKVTRPHIESQEASFLEWVNNILNGTAEQNKIVYNNRDEETGFVMLTDMKENESIDLIIIPRKNIKSLRDLNEAHLPLLKSMKDVGTSVMREKYGLPPHQVKMSLHYQPTYYYLHVLVADSMSKYQGEHLLSTVINNIEMIPDYYQRSELSFFLKKSHALCKKYQESGIITLDEA